MRAVNLLPRDSGQRQLKKESLPVLVGGCSGLLVAALLGLWLLVAFTLAGTFAGSVLLRP